MLLVRDVVAAANYYRECVGFDHQEFYGAPPDFCICQRDGHYLMLARAPDPAQTKPLWQLRENTWNAYFWVDDADTFPVGPGQAVFIPKAAYHSTVNTGWGPLVLLAIYAPAGAEEALKGLPDHRELAPGEVPRLARS